MAETVEQIIEKKMETFNEYLEYSNMDKKQYQYDGVKWCLKKEIDPTKLSTGKSSTTAKGGFITDEMGLGKTIMMIGLMLCNPVRRTLIVLPPILIDQWVNQIYRTTGNTVLVYHGANKKKTSLAELMRAQVVITTYGAITMSKKKLELIKFFHQRSARDIDIRKQALLQQ